MVSLAHLLSSAGSLLILDAASARIQVGLLVRDQPARWAQADEEAGTGLFRCLDQLEVEVDAINAVVFCEGPGSVLGIRTSAMCLRAWNELRPRALWSYRSLELVARSQRAPVAVIADARRDTWHLVSTSSLELERVPTAALPANAVMPEHFRVWSSLPHTVPRVGYDVGALLEAVRAEPLFREAPEPDAFLHENPSYVTWTPQIHRAPT